MKANAASAPLSSLAEIALSWLEQLESRGPALLAAGLVLVAGWLLALLIRLIVRRLSRQAVRVLDRAFGRERRQRAVSLGALALLGELAFWITLVAAFALAAQIAGFFAIAAWLNDVVTHLPDIAAGAAIIVAGFIVAVVLGEQVAEAARKAGARSAAMIGRIVQATVFAAALIIGLGQIGIDVTLLIALSVVITAAILLGMAVAFGLGANAFVADVIAARALRRQLSPGLRVRIGEHEGQVLELAATYVAIDSASGKTMIPARLVTAQPIILLDAFAAPEAPDG